MSAYADLIATTPAAGIDRSTPLGELIWDAARQAVAARKNLDQKLAGLASDVTDLTQGQANGGLPGDGNFATRGAEVDVAIVKLQAAENTFYAIVDTIVCTQQSSA